MTRHSDTDFKLFNCTWRHFSPKVGFVSSLKYQWCTKTTHWCYHDKLPDFVWFSFKGFEGQISVFSTAWKTWHFAKFSLSCPKLWMRYGPGLEYLCGWNKQALNCPVKRPYWERASSKHRIGKTHLKSPYRANLGRGFCGAGQRPAIDKLAVIPRTDQIFFTSSKAICRMIPLFCCSVTLSYKYWYHVSIVLSIAILVCGSSFCSIFYVFSCVCILNGNDTFHIKY